MKQEKKEYAFKIFFTVTAIAVLLIDAFRCALVPFAHDEAGTFFVYIQTGDFLPFSSQADAGNHVLNTFLSWICFRLFGDSPFALRIPNLAALLLLVALTWKFSRRLKNNSSRFILAACFLLSWHWLSFYSVGRGYGLSMSLLATALYFLDSYFQSERIKYVALFCLFAQLATGASLILLVVSLVLTGLLLFFQLTRKKLLNGWNFLIMPLHFLLFFFWIKFSFFLSASNALYYGAGDSYWQTTFISVAEMLSGIKNPALLSGIVLISLLLVLTGLFLAGKKIKNLSAVFELGFFLPATLLLLVLAFFLMKILMGINYPEDRTGLFLYLFFSLSLAFIMDRLPAKIQSAFAIFIVGIFSVQFFPDINFSRHSLFNYETTPARYYEKLLQEQKQSSEKIIVGAHHTRQLVFAFQNYRHNNALNLIDPQGSIQPDCDYLIEQAAEKKSYEKFYTEIDRDNDWGTVLLKRKEKLKRNLVLSVDTLKEMSGKNEFYGFYEKSDTTFSNISPILVEIEINVERAQTPLLAWLVFEITDAEEKNTCYKRVPLNWLRYNWNKSGNQTCSMLTGVLPKKAKRIACYLWNYGGETIQFKVTGLKFYRLEN